MSVRMANPVSIVPDALTALLAVGRAARQGGVPEGTLNLVVLRASQINGCGYCVDLHARQARQVGETDQRLWGVAAWRETAFYSAAERAALALTEAVTRLSDRSDPVPDEVWAEAASHYSEKELAGLILTIGLINFWNRVNVATGQPAEPAAD